MRALFLGILVLLLTPSVRAQEDSMETRWVVILSATKSFEEAREDARKFAKESGIPFTMRGMIFDKRGLRYPDDFDVPGMEGVYASRSHNYAIENGRELEVFLSIEKSEAYEGFKPGYYIVVAGIEESPELAAKRRKAFEYIAPQAYIKKTRIFMGCQARMRSFRFVV